MKRTARRDVTLSTAEDSLIRAAADRPATHLRRWAVIGALHELTGRALEDLAAAPEYQLLTWVDQATVDNSLT